MINFRYHVVSLTSVFLALAVGLVLGTAALNGPITDKLEGDLRELRESNSNLRDEVLELRGSVSSRDDFVRQVSVSTMGGGTLANRSVVIVEGPGSTSKEREGVITSLNDGGAAITGSIRLDDDFTVPRKDEALHDLSSQYVPAGVTLPESGKGIVTASALLGSVLLKGVEVSEADRTTVLQAFSEAGLLVVEQPISTQADAVIFLLGSGFTDKDAGARNASLVTLMTQFDQITPYDVASAPTAGNEPLAAVRADEALSSRLSTVDGLSSAEGQLVTAMALVEQFAGKAGAYGTGEGKDARVPKIR